MNASEEFVPGAHYHFLTPTYELVAKPFLRTVWEVSAEETIMRCPINGTVLDLGCGPGTVLRNIHEKRKDIRLHGIDVDPKMIAAAEKKSMGLGIQYVTATAEDLPFDDRSVDVVVSSMVFHHLPLNVKHGSFAEINRILKPNGEFLLCDFSKDLGKESMSNSWRTQFQSAILRIFEPEILPQLTGQIYDLAKQHGAEVEKIWFPGNFIGLHSIRFHNSNGN